MRIVARDGAPCTPAGVFRRALFAVLALSPRGARSRETLKLLFWADRTPEHASSSLRTALFRLKADLRPLGEDILETTDQEVRLDVDRLWIDVLALRAGEPPGALGAGVQAELLEGIDLCLGAESGFEEWLLAERQACQALAPEITQPRRGASADAGARLVAGLLAETAPGPSRGRPLCVALLPAVTGGETDPSGLADAALAALSAALGEAIGAEILDRRDPRAMHPASPGAPTPDAALLLTLRRSEASLWLRVDLTDLATGASLASHAAELPLAGDLPGPARPGDLDLAAFVAQATDRIALAADRLARRGEGPQAGAYEALRLMFELQEAALASAERIIGHGLASRRSALFEGLAAYLETIRIGENPVDGEPDARQVNLALGAARAVERSPQGGLALTTAGYALDFLAADTGPAERLMRRAVAVSPTLPLAWDNLAMLLFRRGAYDQALASARRAVILGARSPLLNSYETSLCMIQMVRGQYLEAAYYGLRALRRNPRYTATVNYTAASLGFLQRLDEAAQVLDGLKAREPQACLAQIEERAMIRFDPEALRRLIDGLRRAGLS